MSPTSSLPLPSSLFFQGANPTADLALFRMSPRGPETLLIVRSVSSPACPGLPAFPGGFIESSTGRGMLHQACETPEQAARRELLEETGVAAGVEIELIACGVWDAPWRDPRNGDGKFARSHLFCAMVPESFGSEPQGLDDAEEGLTRWVPISELAGREMAFDHGQMLSAACTLLGLKDPKARSWAVELSTAKLAAKLALDSALLEVQSRPTL